MHRSRWLPLATVAGLIVALAACADEAPTAPTFAPDFRHVHQPPSSDAATPALIRELAAEHGIGRLERPRHVRQSLIELGQALAFDPILSGNHDVSCMTCHLPSFETGDGRSLSVGAGGTGMGPERTHPDGTFIPRNAPALFNAGVLQHMFWDGRVEVDSHGHFHTPAGAQLTPEMERVFEFGAVSAQPMFPVIARTEMRGQSGNELTEIPDDSAAAIWAGLMHRLGTIPAYRKMFEKAYPHTRFRDMNFAYASNAIAGFLVSQLTFTNSPWDRLLAGSNRALTQQQLEGARSFLTLKCSVCHTGPTFSDDQFHDVAVAQIGPGQGQGMQLHDDFGRMNVTGDPADRYRFRTTPLRNVELTAPYGHDGAIMTLHDFVEHYSDADTKLLDYDPSQLEPDLQGTLLPNADAIIAQRDTLLDGVVLTPELVDNLVAYMQSLTDPAARDLSRIVPRRVPSGLPVGQPSSHDGNDHGGPGHGGHDHGGPVHGGQRHGGQHHHG